MSENSITDLFQTDPLLLTDRDFDTLIEHYRKNRLNFNIATKQTTSTAAAKKVEKGNALAERLNISLDDFEV